ncbi:hypothetical protein BP5796_07657 [Coleophoma crateriformis]|uniref:Lysosomal dipeptide transporter MFSD1 n=1 Tax=Coleophoma crateriformis TaxID=565419 RepID=A0A3D8RJJ2_9HELO|nr:hypothetical protein BP5796_07657 [Coleophoma crateriformis]
MEKGSDPVTSSKLVEMPPKSVLLHYSILVAVSCMYLGVYWIYDLPAALSTPLQAYLALTDLQYTYLNSSLYIAFAIPSIILPFLSGFAIQKYGARVPLLFCLAAVLGSQLGFCISVQFKSTVGLVMSRILLGMGGEVMGVLGTEVVTRWFPGKKTGLAMAIYESLSSLGSVANSGLTPRLIATYAVLTATWFSSILALGLVVLSTIYIMIEDSIEEPEEEEGKKGNFMASLRRLPRSFWYIAFICLSGYGCLLPFFNSAQRFLASRFYADNQTKAGLAVSIVHFVGGVTPMFLGLLLEIPALRNYSLALFFSQVFMLVAHVLFLADYGSAILPLSLLGLGNALFSAGIWASVSVSILQAEGTEYMPLELELLRMEEQESVAGLDIEEGGNPSTLETEVGTLDSEGLLGIDSKRPVAEENEHDNELVMIGYGLITSLMSISIVVVPIFLSAAEGWAGFSGLELVFVVLAGIGVCTSLGLVLKEKELK